MMGKIIAGVLGWMVAGPIGAIAGLYLGHQFDRGLANLSVPLTAEQQQRIGACFFETTFSLLGHLAKSDGRISKSEIAQAEALMVNMGLTPDHRLEAIALFKAGSQSDFSLDQAMQRFVSICGRQSNLVQSLLNYLIILEIGRAHV